MTESAESKSPVIVDNRPEARRRRWLDDRRKAITATDAAQVVGVSRYGGPMEIYLDKVGLKPETVANEAMQAGNWFQKPILDWYADRLGVAIVHEPEFTFIRSAEMSRIGASLDARRIFHAQTVDYDGRPIDAKNIGRPKEEEWGENGSDQIPLHYAVQLVVQMYVTRTVRADLAVLFRGQELRVYTLNRDAELEADIVERCQQFWNTYVETQTPPPVDGSASWTDYLKRTFRSHSDVTLRATSALHEAAVQLHVTKDQIEALELIQAQHENTIKLAIGEAKAMEGPGWRVTWTKAKDSTKVDGGALAVAYAEKLTFLATLFSNPDRLRLYEGEGGAALAADIRDWLKSFPDEHTITKEGSRRFTFNYKG